MNALAINEIAQDHVVVIDDQDEDIFAINRYLTMDNTRYSVKTFTDPQEGLEYCRQFSPDLLLVDFNLPEMTGLDVIDSLKESGVSTSVIMLTGQGNERVAVKALKSGAVDYLVKSELNRESLNKAVGGAIERSRMQQTIAAQREELTRRAYYDGLTGLPNRTYFLENLGRILASHNREKRMYAVLFVDLNKFKPVNDLYGHEIGDEVLVQVAGRVENCLRTSDFAARLGGDEFVIFLDNLNTAEGATKVVSRLKSRIEEPIWIDNRQISISASIGVVIDDGSVYTKVNHLLRDADIAMYRVKKEGKSGFEIFDKQQHAQVLRHMQIETDLKRAISEDQLLLMYQPIHDPTDNHLCSVEALVRWIHPELGIISPAEFIPIAEESRSIIEVGSWVLKEGIPRAKTWFEQWGITMSINVSAVQLLEPGFPALVAGYLTDANCPGEAITLELTESILMKENEFLVANLAELKRFGVNFAIDDFGNGHSSLNSLRKNPVDILKIDRAFIRDVMDSETDQVLTKFMISMARELNLKIVAEGVETSEQLEFLSQADCHLVQGYFFSKPLLKDDLEEYISSRTKG